MNDHGDKEDPHPGKHIGSDLLLGLFFTFVAFMVLYHFYLRRQSARRIEDKQQNLYKFEWEKEDD